MAGAGRALLQLAVAIGGLVPVAAGVAGMAAGPAFLADQPSDLGLDSHVRYLSGLLAGIGLAFWSTIPAIERRTGRFRLLTAIVVLGGLGRLYGALVVGVPPPTMLFGLGMELIVTPLLCVWQGAVAQRGRRRGFR